MLDHDTSLNTGSTLFQCTTCVYLTIVTVLGFTGFRYIILINIHDILRQQLDTHLDHTFYSVSLL